MKKSITKICEDYVPSDLDIILDDSRHMSRLFSLAEVRMIIKEIQKRHKDEIEEDVLYLYFYKDGLKYAKAYKLPVSDDLIKVINDSHALAIQKSKDDANK
jgi:hypothetical protein